MYICERCGNDTDDDYYESETKQQLCFSCYEEVISELIDKHITDFAKANLPDIKILHKEYCKRYKLKSKSILRTFEGNCAAVADTLYRILPAEFKKVTRISRGHWTGKDVRQQGRTLQQHSWLTCISPEDSETFIIDPTQFVFTGATPQISVVTSTDYYDEASIKLRAAIHTAKFPERSKETSASNLSLSAQAQLSKALSKRDWSKWSKEEIFAIANTDPARLGKEAKPIYLELKNQGYSAFIPLDTYNLVMEKTYHNLQPNW